MDKRTDLEPNQLYFDTVSEKKFYVTDEIDIVWMTEEEATEKYGDVGPRPISIVEVAKEES
jgi:hypothetical protein